MLTLTHSTSAWFDHLSLTDSTQFNDTITFTEEQDGSNLFDLFFTVHLDAYNNKLTRYSPEMPLSLSESTSSKVIWDAILPPYTDIVVEYSLSENDEDWTPWSTIQNGQCLNGFSGQYKTRQLKIKFKQTLTTTDISVSPILKQFGIYVENTHAMNTREEWQLDTRLLGKFNGNLEAGNIDNNGIPIDKFAIKRRNKGTIDPIVIGYLPFENNKKVEYYDYSQPNIDLIYSVVPIGNNNLEGKPNDVEIKSDFIGYFLVDTETDTVIPFNAGFSLGDVEMNYNQSRAQVDTFYKYPRFIYTGQNYHTFSLNGVLIPSENETSHGLYRKLIDLIDQHKPLVVKGSNHSVYITDVSNPKVKSPQNSYQQLDYLDVTLEFVEIMDYEDYLRDNPKDLTLGVKT